MPEEVMVIAVTAIIAIAVTVLSIAGMITKSVRQRNQSRRDGSPSLTQSELQHLLRDAVEEGTLPLYRKIEALENKLDRAQLVSAERTAPRELEEHRQVN